MTLKEAVECLTNPNVHEMILPPNQLTEWLTELKEAKRLLKLALQDLAEVDHCGLCKHESDDIATCQRKPINCFVWRYADEALKLIGGSENG